MDENTPSPVEVYLLELRVRGISNGELAQLVTDRVWGLLEVASEEEVILTEVISRLREAPDSKFGEDL